MKKKDLIKKLKRKVRKMKEHIKVLAARDCCKETTEEPEVVENQPEEITQ